jgi:hypothetical protein
VRKSNGSIEDQSAAAEDNMQDTPIEPMSAENVEEFDVLVFDSWDLMVTVIPLQAPWKLAMENYNIWQES